MLGTGTQHSLDHNRLHAAVRYSFCVITDSTCGNNMKKPHYSVLLFYTLWSASQAALNHVWGQNYCLDKQLNQLTECDINSGHRQSYPLFLQQVNHSTSGHFSRELLCSTPPPFQLIFFLPLSFYMLTVAVQAGLHLPVLHAQCYWHWRQSNSSCIVFFTQGREQVRVNGDHRIQAGLEMHCFHTRVHESHCTPTDGRVVTQSSAVQSGQMERITRNV